MSPVTLGKRLADIAWSVEEYFFSGYKWKSYR
jgi:hypothetical protein